MFCLVEQPRRLAGVTRGFPCPLSAVSSSGHVGNLLSSGGGAVRLRLGETQPRTPPGLDRGLSSRPRPVRVVVAVLSSCRSPDRRCCWRVSGLAVFLLPRPTPKGCRINLCADRRSPSGHLRICQKCALAAQVRKAFGSRAAGRASLSPESTPAEPPTGDGPARRRWSPGRPRSSAAVGCCSHSRTAGAVLATAPLPLEAWLDRRGKRLRA